MRTSFPAPRPARGRATDGVAAAVLPWGVLGRVVLTALVLTLLGCSLAPGGTPDTVAGDATTTTVGPSDVAADPSVGCGTAPDVAPNRQAPGDRPEIFALGGRFRLYRLSVPAGYDPDEPAPLVLNLHGLSSNAEQQSVYSGLPIAASDRGILVASPDAGDTAWDDGDDTFLVALTRNLTERYCIDRNRVWLTGMSLGALRSAITICAHPEIFAAAGLVAFDDRPAGCPSTSIIAFHGTGDLTVEYGLTVAAPFASGPLPRSEANLVAWAEGAGCAPAPDLAATGEDVTRAAFLGCEPGREVVFYSIAWAGHTWPGSAIEIESLGGTTDTIDATALILDFLQDHPRMS